MWQLICEILYVICFFTFTVHASSDTEIKMNTVQNSQNQNFVENKQILITSEDECEALIDVNPSLKYRVQMNLLNSSCSSNPDQKGFNCRLTFHQKDKLALVASNLCIDIQGIPKTLPDTQLSFAVFNQLQQKLRGVYATNRLLPEDAPYFICSNESQSTLSVSLSVLSSVKICPNIMKKMMGSIISFGSVMMKPALPTYILSMDNCSSDVVAKENEYILKVSLEGYNAFCNLHIIQNNSNSNTNSCIELIYVSLDYRCNISVELFMSSHSIIRFDVPPGSAFPSLKRQQFCKSYSDADNNGLFNLVLIIQRYTKSTCFGNFAVKTSFTESDLKDTEDDNFLDNMRQIYMGVFISLISVCLLILCVICVFCLYMRSKRLRRTQRQELQNAPASNVGFEAAGMDFGNQDVSLNRSNPSEVHGLPAYDDIFGKNFDVTANHELTTDQKPPDYDDLFSSRV